MQIPRCLLIAAAAMISASPVFVRADTEAQIKARQALEEKMSELQGQPGPAASNSAPPASQPTAPSAAERSQYLPMPAPSSPSLIEQAREAERARWTQLEAQKAGESAAQPPAAPPPAPVPAQPAPQPPVAVAPAVPAVPAAPAAQTPDQSLIEKAQEAERQKISQLNAGKAQQAAPQAITPAPAVAPVPAPQPAPMAPAAAPVVAAPAPQQAAPPDVLEQAREAERQKMSELNTRQGTGATATAAPVAERTGTGGQPVFAAPPSQPSSSPAVEQAQQALNRKMSQLQAQEPPPAARRPSNALSQALPPLPAPPPPDISATKEQQLRQLLNLYMADKISPEAYHEQRARILGLPQ